MEFLSAIPTDLCITLGMCLLASLSVAILMRFFVKPACVKLDEFIASKLVDEKGKAVYATVKAYALTAIACALTIFFLARLMKICVFPADGNKALAPFYFIPMLALQYFFDAHMKRIACKMFGLPYEEDVKTEEVKEPKPEKCKIHGVWYIKDANGNFVPLEEV